jgi:hypothetical protein
MFWKFEIVNSNRPIFEFGSDRFRRISVKSIGFVNPGRVYFENIVWFWMFAGIFVEKMNDQIMNSKVYISKYFETEYMYSAVYDLCCGIFAGSSCFCCP